MHGQSSLANILFHPECAQPSHGKAVAKNNSTTKTSPSRSAREKSSAKFMNPRQSNTVIDPFFLKFETVKGPSCGTVVDSAAICGVLVPFESPIHLFRLTVAQEGDLLKYLCSTIKNLAGKFADGAVQDGVLMVVPTDAGVSERKEGGMEKDCDWESIPSPGSTSAAAEKYQSDWKTEKSFPIDKYTTNDIAEGIYTKHSSRRVSENTVTANDSWLHESSFHPSILCKCMWCYSRIIKADAQRHSTILAATETIITFCGHRLELQNKLFEVCPDLFDYLLPLFPYPPSPILAYGVIEVGSELRIPSPMTVGSNNFTFDDEINSLSMTSVELDQSCDASHTSHISDATVSVTVATRSASDDRSDRKAASSSVKSFKLGSIAPIEIKPVVVKTYKPVRLLGQHLGVAGSCCQLAEAVIHRHDSIRMAVRMSGCVGGMVRALEIAAQPVLSGVDIKAAKGDIADRSLGMKVVSLIEILIVRNPEAWEQIQREAGVRGLLRLCRVGTGSIRVLSATTLEARITKKSNEKVKTAPLLTTSNRKKNEIEDRFSHRIDTKLHDEAVGLATIRNRNLTETIPMSPFGNSRTDHSLLAEVSTFMGSSMDLQSVDHYQSHKDIILGDRIKGISLLNITSSILNNQSTDARDSIFDSTVFNTESVTTAFAAATNSNFTGGSTDELSEEQISDAIRRRLAVEELIYCGAIEAITSMLLCPDTDVQAGGLRFLLQILQNSAADIRLGIISAKRPAETYQYLDRNGDDFVYLGSTCESNDYSDKYRVSKLSQHQMELQNTTENKEAYAEEFPISLPMIGKFLYSSDLCVIRAATDVLLVLASANPIEVRKILKVHQLNEENSDYKPPEFIRSDTIEVFTNSPTTQKKKKSRNPYETMESINVPSIVSSTRLGIFPDIEPLSPNSSRNKQTPPPKTVDENDEHLPELFSPGQSRIGYRLLDLSVGRIVPLARMNKKIIEIQEQHKREQKGDSTSSQKVTATVTKDSKWTRDKNRLPPEYSVSNYLPHRGHYIKEPVLIGELDMIARNAALLVAVTTGFALMLIISIFRLKCYILLCTDSTQSDCIVYIHYLIRKYVTVFLW